MACFSSEHAKVTAVLFSTGTLTPAGQQEAGASGAESETSAQDQFTPLCLRLRPPAGIWRAHYLWQEHEGHHFLHFSLPWLISTENQKQYQLDGERSKKGNCHEPYNSFWRDYDFWRYRAPQTWKQAQPRDTIHSLIDRQTIQDIMQDEKSQLSEGKGISLQSCSKAGSSTRWTCTLWKGCAGYMTMYD